MNWIAVIAAFLLGSIPFGLIIARARGVDVRSVGSGNIGATNVGRSVGKHEGALTLACVQSQYDYARGWAFLEYFDAKYGRAKVKAFLDLVYRKKKSVPEAAAEVTGIEWEKLAKAEERWARAWIKKYKIR